MSIVTRDMKGQSCTFRSLAANDSNTYVGVIDSTGLSYDMAKGYCDAIPINAAVRLVDPTVTTDLDNLSFFSIKMSNASGTTVIKAFAEEWLQPGSFTLLNQRVKRTFVIYADATTTASDIIAVNRSAGFDITEVTSS